MSREHPAADTRERILDCAEELFATRGIAATSLRTLTRAAKVNLAAVHYHFGSKEALLDAVLARRAQTVNGERLVELERLSDASGGAPSVETILSAFVLPSRRHQSAAMERGANLSRLLARIHAESPELVESLTREHFGEVMSVFVKALQAALPELPPDEVVSRFRFSMGALLHVFSPHFAQDAIPGYPARFENDAELTSQLITYLAAGMQASISRSQAPQLKVAVR